MCVNFESCDIVKKKKKKEDKVKFVKTEDHYRLCRSVSNL